MFGLKTKRLCKLVSQEIEKKGYCVWPIKPSKRMGNYNLGVTLPDNINQSEEEMKKFRNVMKDISSKYMDADINFTEPLFSAGGAYASYLSVKPADLVQIL